MRKKSLLAVLSILSFVLLAVSCTVTQAFNYTDSKVQAGTASGKIKVTDFFVNVVEDLASWTTDRGDDAITDVAVSDFETNLKASGQAFGVSFTKNPDGTYNSTFSFKDFQKLVEALSGLEDQDIITVTQASGRTRLDFKINMDNWETLTQIVPFLADPNFAVYGPLYNNYMEEEDYLDMIAFILGDDGPQSITDSEISIEISTPNPIKATNAKKVNSTTVRFTFPLIEFLLLHNGISFWCEF